MSMRYLFGVPVAAFTMDEALDEIERAIADRRQLQIGVVNAAKIVNMRQDAGLQEAVLSCDLILADGMAVVWASRVLRQPLPERVAGIDLMTGMLERANKKGYRVYCLGATQQVIEAAVRFVRERYPNAKIAGYRNGYFSAIEEAGVAREIAAAHPDILLVGMTSPKKEQFLARWSEELQVPICHGVGGSFDVISGKVHRAPVVWQNLGLEWLYRVLQEPGRLWKRYLITNAAFSWLVAVEYARQLVRRRRADPVEGPARLSSR